MAHLEPQQVRKAAVAILKYAEKNAGLLSEDGELIYVQISVKKIPDSNRKKPFRIPLPNPIYSAMGRGCLLVKDPQREYKDLLMEKKVGGIEKVIGVTKLKANYKTHEAKRELCHSYPFFMADDRIIPLLPGLLGKEFFKKKKQPIPVNIAKKDLVKNEIKKAQSSTYMHVGEGPCSSIKIALSNMSEDEVYDNIFEGVNYAVQNFVAQKWKNVQTVTVKTAESVALPIFNSLPEAVLKVNPKDKAAPAKKGKKKQPKKPDTSSEDEEDSDE